MYAVFNLEVRLLSNKSQLVWWLQIVNKSSKTGRRLDSFFHPDHFYLPLTTVRLSVRRKKGNRQERLSVKVQNLPKISVRSSNRRLQISCNFPNVSQMSVHVLSVLPDVISMSHVSRIIEPTAKSGSFHGQSTYHLKISRE